MVSMEVEGVEGPMATVKICKYEEDYYDYEDVNRMQTRLLQKKKPQLWRVTMTWKINYDEED